jgi:hypothetical protein
MLCSTIFTVLGFLNLAWSLLWPFTFFDEFEELTREVDFKLFLELTDDLEEFWLQTDLLSLEAFDLFDIFD